MSNTLKISILVIIGYYAVAFTYNLVSNQFFGIFGVNYKPTLSSSVIFICGSSIFPLVVREVVNYFYKISTFSGFLIFIFVFVLQFLSVYFLSEGAYDLTSLRILVPFTLVFGLLIWCFTIWPAIHLTRRSKSQPAAAGTPQSGAP